MTESMFRVDRWEQGSNFHLPDFGSGRAKGATWQEGTVRWYGCGRMALQALLDHGQKKLGWRKAWLPSYYCEDVPATLNRIGIERYPCLPGRTPDWPNLREGEVLIRVSYFGWPIEPVDASGGHVIDDFSHWPGQLPQSSADFAFASLRKCFPLPDGGMAWSPADLELPELPVLSDSHEQLALKRHSAMSLKRAYLLGAEFDKTSYRELEQATEAALRADPPSAMCGLSLSILNQLPPDFWQAARAENHEALSAQLNGTEAIRLLMPPKDIVPMVAVLRLANRDVRDELRRMLAAEAIYTAVLWPPPAGPGDWYGTEEQSFSDTTLCVHIDGRYRTDDIVRVAEKIRASMNRLAA